MDYIGSKEKSNTWIFRHILKHFADPTNKIFLDACAGSGSVSRFAASTGFRVLACDNLAFPSHVVNGSIGVLPWLTEARKHIELMNNIPGVDGYFFQNFCESAGRLYFTDENARRLDACRQYLNNIDDPKLFSILMYSLIEGMSRISNTAGTYGAYLKKFKERALKPLKLQIEEYVGEGVCYTWHANINDMLQACPMHKDVIYIDPPYNQRQYGPNYHLYEALAIYDHSPVNGITGLRDWSESRSGFCRERTFFELLEKILHNANCSLIFLSYSSDGLISRDQIENFLLQYPVTLSVHVLPQKRYKADANRQYNESFLKEFLFEIEQY